MELSILPEKDIDWDVYLIQIGSEIMIHKRYELGTWQDHPVRQNDDVMLKMKSSSHLVLTLYKQTSSIKKCGFYKSDSSK